MTTVYFVRHAQPNFANHDDLTRELTAKGMADRLLVLDLLAGVPVDAVLSSPYRRAVDTVQPLADERGLGIRAVEDFRERRVDSCWIEDFDGFCRAQWADFDYRLTDGETLRQVQRRNMAALEAVLVEFAGQTVVIGSHGTALSTIINHYDPTFGHADFEKIRGLMPWVVRFTFEGMDCVDNCSYDVFQRTEERRQLK